MSDPIAGAAGSTLTGTADDDVFHLTGAPARVDGLGGVDTILVMANIVFASGSVLNVETFQVQGSFKATLSALSAGYRITAVPDDTRAINVVGSTGADTIIGGDGNDTIDAAQGNDYVDGGKGNDTITGGPGYDTLLGGEGDDVIQVKRGTGGDYIDGGSGTDRLSLDAFTRTGNLTLDISNPSIAQTLGEGSTIIRIEQVSITGGSGDDRFIGGNLADTLNGSGGDDVLEGRGGNDTIAGGDDYDVAVFSGAYSDYQITNLGNGSWRVSGGSDGTDTLTGIETLRFADGDRPIGGYNDSAIYWGSNDGTATLQSASNIPDGRGAHPGTGFTITGLVRMADGTFWAANEGQADAYDTTYTPSLVRIAADGTTKLGELVLPSSVRAVQGLAVDEVNGRLFYASLSEKIIRIVTYSGSQLGTMTLPTGVAPNAVAYDPVNNALIVGLSNGSANNKVVQWRSLSDNSVIKTLDVGVNPDHLFINTNKGAAGTLYVSYGDAPGIGYVAEFDIATGVRTGVWSLPDADAIEGIAIVGNTLWAANDAYYHNGDPVENRILKFSIDQANALQLVRDGSSTGLDIDLSRHDQTLADGTRLVGVQRLFFEGGSGNDSVRGGAFDDVLVGNGGADRLRGAGGNDRLVGGAGDDILEGGAGNDGLEGGTGTDTAVFSGARSSYTIDQLSATSVRVTHSGGDGIDLVAEVEKFQFSDGTFDFAELFTTVQPLGDIVVSARNVAETAATGSLIGTLSMSASASGIVYSLVNSAGGRFAIDGDELVLGATAIDFEASSSHTITIRATDVARQRSVDLTTTVTVLDRNDAPTDIAISNQVALPEDASIETRVADLSVVDPDTSAAFRQNVVTVDDARFLVRDGVLYLRAGQALDNGSEPTIALTLTASDGSSQLQKQLNVSVVAAAVPSEIGLTSSVSNENVAVGSIVGRLSLSPGAIGAVTYTLVDDAGGMFRIQGSDLVVDGLLDHEAGATRQVVVRGTDSAGRSVTATQVIQITDRNDAPTALSASAPARIGDGTPFETRIADLTVTDQDTNPAFRTYSWTVSDARFEVKAGALYLKAGQSVSSDTEPLINVTVTVNDGAGSRQVVVSIPVGGATEGDDRGEQAIFGTAGNDTLSGLGGHDQLYGLAGNDTLNGGIGDDDLEGGAGADVLRGDAGSDTAAYTTASTGVRVELSKPSNNTGDAAGDTYNSIENIRGSDFADRLTGDNAANKIWGGKGADIISGGGGADALYGEDGDDTISGQGGNDTIVGGAGDDTLSGGAGGWDLFQFSGGWGRDQILDYEARLDILDFTPGGITIHQLSIVQVGADTQITGPNGEVLIVRNTLRENLIIRTSEGEAPSLDISLSATSIVENSAQGTVVGTLSTTTTQGNTSFTYALVDNAGGRFALNGVNLVATGTGLNHEAAETHNVRIRVTDGAGRSAEEVFTIAVGDANDAPTDIAVSNLAALVENTTIETKVADLSVVDADTDPAFRAYSYAVNDARFIVKNGALYLRAGQVVDYEVSSSIPVVVTVTDGTTSFSKSIAVAVADVNEAAATTFNGTNGNDAITSDADFINGRKGDDTIYAAGRYTVTVSGGEGDDRIEYIGVTGSLIAHGDDQADTIIGGANADQLYGDGGTDTLFGHGGDDYLNGGDSADIIWGGDGNDEIIGGTGADFLYGGAGNDRISGGTDQDFLEGGLGADILDGGAQVDTASYASATTGVRASLIAPSSNTGEAAGDVYISIENLLGSAFNDELFGNDASNRLTGGAGNDMLAGYGGTDVLLGGEGDDTLLGQGGNDQLDGGLGNDTLSGGLTSNDTFIFVRLIEAGQAPIGWGHDIVTDFEQGRDHLAMQGSGLGLASLTITQQGANTYIYEAQSQSSVTLLNFNSALLNAGDFYF